MRLLSGFLLAVMTACSQSTPAFTVVEVTRHFDPAGKLKSESRFLFAMNREGSFVSVDLDPAAGSTRQIIDVVNHRTLLVDPNSRTASITALGSRGRQLPDPCDQRFRSMPGVVMSVHKSVRAISGVSVDRISITLPNGTSMETDVAPSLQCHMLEATIRRDGAVVNKQTIENLQLGDPDPNLFAVPAGYRISTVKLQQAR